MNTSEPGASQAAVGRTSANGFYLHGDVGFDGRAYCARCWRFYRAAHFAEHPELNRDLYRNGQRLLAELGKVAKVVVGRANLFASGTE